MMKWILIVAVSLTLTGSGTVGDILPGWNVSEDATPVAPGDFSGGVGSVSLTVEQGVDSEFVIDNFSTFTDSVLGSISGKVASATSNGATEATDTSLPLTLTTPLTKLSAERTAPPIWLEDLRLGNFAYGTSALGQYGVVNYTTAITVDPLDDSIFVASYGVVPASVGGGAVSADKYLVVKYSSTGTYITQFGGDLDAFGVGTGTFNPGIPGSFGGLLGISVSPTTGVVAVSDSSKRNISLFTPNVGRTLYTYTSEFGAPGTGNGQFGSGFIPVTHDATGAIYAGDRGNSRIQKFTSAGVYSAQVAISGFYPGASPYDIDFDNSTGLVHASLVIGGGGVATAPVIRAYNTSLVAQYDIPYSYTLTSDGSPEGFLFFDARSDGTIWSSLSGRNFAVRVNTSGVELERAYSNNAVSSNLNDTYGVVVGVTNGYLYMLDRYLDVSTNTSVFRFAEPRVQIGAFQLIQLSSAIQTYVDLIDSSLVVNYTAVEDPDIFLPGWVGSVWDKLKEICSAYALQVDSSGGVITISDVGDRTLSLDNVASGSVSLSLDSRATGRSINVAYQQATGGQGVLYDAANFDKVFSVGVGETVTETVETGNYPVELNSVTQTSFIPPQPSQYYVTASDNLPVTPAQWAAYGGSVTVAVGATPGTIDVTLVGPRTVIPGVTAPFRLAVSDGTTDYPAFSVTGSGVFTDPQVLNLLTGADPDKTPTEVAADINNFAINTKAQAYDRGIWASVIASGPLLTLTATVPTSAIAGFGLCEGSLVSFKESQYRVTTASIGNTWTSITATRHVTVGERDALHAGRTVGQHDTLWDGNQCEDEFIKPFRQ